MLDGFYMVDAYVPSLNLCIEINGPAHYTFNGLPNMKSVMKSRLLNKLGYKFVSVDALDVLRNKNIYLDYRAG